MLTINIVGFRLVNWNFTKGCGEPGKQTKRAAPRFYFYALLKKKKIKIELFTKYIKNYGKSTRTIKSYGRY